MREPSCPFEIRTEDEDGWKTPESHFPVGKQPAASSTSNIE
jgi:hypothetical protein